MDLFVWDDAKYSVNVKEFNEHHKIIVDMINSLHNAMMQGKGKDALIDILKKLKEYTQYHFSAEEKLMLEKVYVSYFEHKKQHDMFIEKIDEFTKKYNDPTKEITQESYNFLKEWLIKHIQGTDKKYSEFFAKKGIV